MPKHWILVGLLLLPISTVHAQTAPADPAASDRSGIESIPLEIGSSALKSTTSDRLSLTLTFSPDAPTQVQDERDLALLPGRNTVEIEGIPAQLDLSALYWTLPEARRLIRLRADADRLEAEIFANEAGSRPIRLRYDLPHLHWQVDYRLILPAASSARLQRFLTLVNETDQAFANPQIILTSPFGEWITLDLASTINPRSQLRQPLGEPLSVSTHAQLVAQGKADAVISETLRRPVEQRITLDAFDPQWPVGRVTIEQEMPDGRFTVLGNGTHSAVVSSFQDASVTRTLVNIEPADADEVQLDWRLIIQNREPQPMTLRLEENLDPRWAVVDGSGDWSRTGATLYREVTIAAEDSEEIRFSVRGPLNPSD